MTTEEYRNHPALNFSSAKHALKSPAEYHANAGRKAEPTKAMIMGTALHTLVLEGAKLSDRFCVQPLFLSLTTKEGREWKASADKPILSKEDAFAIFYMDERIRMHCEAPDILRLCNNRETPLFGRFRGEEIKGMVDAHGYLPALCELIVCDIKTTDDPSPRAFEKTVIERDYDMQAAWYVELLAQNTDEHIEDVYFYWIAVQNKPPYSCVVFDALKFLETGKRKMELAVDTIAECKRSGKWPHPHPGINTLRPPMWYIEKIEREMEAKQ